MKTMIYLVCLATFLCGMSCQTDELKIINTGNFEIEVPANWKYNKAQGVDSFVGSITGEGVNLSFDWSEMGYANPLIPTEKEYIYENTYDWMPINAPYFEAEVVYTSGDVEETRARIMKEKGITDPEKVRVEPFQIPTKEIDFQNGTYTATLTYKDTAIQVKIDIPARIKKHEIEVDTIGRYRRKLIRPKKGEKGITGVYFKDLNADFNFNLAGNVEGTTNQENAIVAFKTIKIKRNGD
ncbi:MAG: hypothetical protein ACPGJS_09450 [Flammeovirgaceae bacterium]